MSATIQYQGDIAIIDNGIWISDNLRLADRLQNFRDNTLAAKQFTIVPAHFDSLDALGAVEFLGGDAKIIQADNDIPEFDSNTIF